MTKVSRVTGPRRASSSARPARPLVGEGVRAGAGLLEGCLAAGFATRSEMTMPSMGLATRSSLLTVLAMDKSFYREFLGNARRSISRGVFAPEVIVYGFSLSLSGMSGIYGG